MGRRNKQGGLLGPPPPLSGIGLNSFMTKLYKSTVSSMSLIQLLKFKKWETKLSKVPHLETPRFQTGTRVTVASEQSLLERLGR